jgi:hypothetical protein
MHLRFGIALLGLTALGAACGGASNAPASPVSGAEIIRASYDAAQHSHYLAVVALVNGQPIAGADVSFDLVGATLGSSLGAPTSVRTPPTPRGVMDSLIKFELLYQEAVRRGLACSAEEAQKYAGDAVGALPKDIAAAFAAGEGVTVDKLPNAPQLLKKYARQCAISRLRVAVTPVDKRQTPAAINQIWSDLQSSLHATATIEVIDPSLK